MEKIPITVLWYDVHLKKITVWITSEWHEVKGNEFAKKLLKFICDPKKHETSIEDR